MKRRLLFAAIALVTLAGCTEDSIVNNVTETPVKSELKAITFASSNAATTRAGEYTGAEAAGKLNDKFIVGGFKGTGTSTVFSGSTISTEGVPATTTVYDNYQVNWVDNSAHTSTSNTTGWEYVSYPFLEPSSLVNTNGIKQSIKYWDYSTTQYDFIAYSTSDATVVTGSTVPTAGQVHVTAINAANAGKKASGAYQLTGDAAALTKCYIADMQTVYRDKDAVNDALGDYNEVVQFKFRSLSSKVRLALYETVPGYSIKNVVFYTDASTPATDGKAYLYTAGSNFNEEGTYTVYFPTIGSSNKSNSDYNKAHLAFTAASGGTASTKDFGALTGDLATGNFATSEGQEAAISGTDKGYLGRSSATATYAGTYANNYYTVVLPNEDGAVLNLKVNYTLISADGSGEFINVTGATATVPAQYAQWKSGYAYTYIFKISDRTNGYTDPSAGPAGLYPITFDAVVTETEDEIQETITTVSEPSITTFGYDAANKKYYPSSTDYALGTTVYATVMANGAVVNTTFMTDLHLYKVALRSGVTNYAITEAAVADAWNHQAVSNITFEHVCTPLYNGSNAADVSKVPGEDGNEKTIDAVMFKPTTAGYYAIQYRATEGVYAAASPQPAVGTDASAYYYEFPVSSGKYFKVGTADDSHYYYTVGALAATGSIALSDGIYFTKDENGNYNKCSTSDVYDSGKTYYTLTETQYDCEPGDNIVGKFTKDGDNYILCTTKAVTGETYYTVTTAPKYTYKVVQIH